MVLPRARVGWFLQALLGLRWGLDLSAAALLVQTSSPINLHLSLLSLNFMGCTRGFGLLNFNIFWKKYNYWGWKRREVVWLLVRTTSTHGDNSFLEGWIFSCPHSFLYFHFFYLSDSVCLTLPKCRIQPNSWLRAWRAQPSSSSCNNNSSFSNKTCGVTLSNRIYWGKLNLLGVVFYLSLKGNYSPNNLLEWPSANNISWKNCISLSL